MTFPAGRTALLQKHKNANKNPLLPVLNLRRYLPSPESEHYLQAFYRSSCSHSSAILWPINPNDETINTAVTGFAGTPGKPFRPELLIVQNPTFLPCAKRREGSELWQRRKRILSKNLDRPWTIAHLSPSQQTGAQRTPKQTEKLKTKTKSPTNQQRNHTNGAIGTSDMLLSVRFLPGLRNFRCNLLKRWRPHSGHHQPKWLNIWAITVRVNS